MSDAVPYTLPAWSLGCIGAKLSISLDTSSSSTGLELDHYWMNYTQVCSIISMMICTLDPTTKTRPRVKLAFVPALGQESAVVAQMVSPSRSNGLGEDDLVIPHLDLGSPGNSSSRYELQPGDTVLVHEAETASASLTRAKHWAMSLVIPEGSLSDSVSLVVSKKGSLIDTSAKSNAPSDNNALEESKSSLECAEPRATSLVVSKRSLIDATSLVVSKRSLSDVSAKRNAPSDSDLKPSITNGKPDGQIRHSTTKRELMPGDTALLCLAFILLECTLRCSWLEAVATMGFIALWHITHKAWNHLMNTIYGSGKERGPCLTTIHQLEDPTESAFDSSSRARAALESIRSHALKLAARLALMY